MTDKLQKIEKMIAALQSETDLNANQRVLLNMYICPYKEKIRSFLPGATITVVAWVLAVLGFSIYLKIGSMSKLYGALSTVIVFLLWLYVLMICFMIGVIFNSEKILLKRERKRVKTSLHKN